MIHLFSYFCLQEYTQARNECDTNWLGYKLDARLIVFRFLGGGGAFFPRNLQTIDLSISNQLVKAIGREAEVRNE